MRLIDGGYLDTLGGRRADLAHAIADRLAARLQYPLREGADSVQQVTRRGYQPFDMDELAPLVTAAIVAPGDDSVARQIAAPAGRFGSVWLSFDGE